MKKVERADETDEDHVGVLDHRFFGSHQSPLTTCHLPYPGRERFVPLVDVCIVCVLECGPLLSPPSPWPLPFPHQ
jgi:hypothetical protein